MKSVKTGAKDRAISPGIRRDGDKRMDGPTGGKDQRRSSHKLPDTIYLVLGKELAKPVSMVRDEFFYAFY